jgi:hypothetical protein
MQYRGYTIYAEGAVNNWTDFELDSDGDIEMTWLIMDGETAEAGNIGGFVILWDGEGGANGEVMEYQDYAKTLDEARKFIDGEVLRDAAAAAVAAWKDPVVADLLPADMTCIAGPPVTAWSPKRLFDTMDALDAALHPPE